jgi:hypothetical protein
MKKTALKPGPLQSVEGSSWVSGGLDLTKCFHTTTLGAFAALKLRDLTANMTLDVMFQHTNFGIGG